MKFYQAVYHTPPHNNKTIKVLANDESEVLMKIQRKDPSLLSEEDIA